MPTKEVEEAADQSFEEIPIQKEKGEEKYRTIFIFGLSFFALIVLLIILSLLIPKPVQLSKIAPTPSPTPTPVEEKITSPSAYATDSAVLKIEQDLKNIDQNLQSTDLKETGLNPPLLDWEVKFETL